VYATKVIYVDPDTLLTTQIQNPGKHTGRSHTAATDPNSA